MRILMQELKPVTGTITWGVTASKSYCPQDVKAIMPKNTNLFQLLHDKHPELDMGSIRGVLGRMLFSGEDGDKITSVLSGGESVRIMLSNMMLDEANVLLLDEPTNHLDLESIEALNDALKQFQGTVFFVSHDREFVSSLANRILEILPTGEIIDFDGNYENYLLYIQRKGK